MTTAYSERYNYMIPDYATLACQQASAEHDAAHTFPLKYVVLQRTSTYSDRCSRVAKLGLVSVPLACGHPKHSILSLQVCSVVFFLTAVNLPLDFVGSIHTLYQEQIMKSRNRKKEAGRSRVPCLLW